MSLYKYLPTHVIDNKTQKTVNLLECIFKDRTLRFSSPLAFNDPFELRPHIEKIIDEEDHLVVNTVSNHINNNGLANEFYYNAVIKPSLPHIGILSLSETHTNLVMWAHYADNHKGIVLELDESHPFFHSAPQNCNLLHRIKKVEYVDARPAITSDGWGSDEKTFLTKSKNWSYEREYRMSILFDNSDTNVNKYNIQFPPEIVKSVYISCKATQDTIEYIKLIACYDEWKHLNIDLLKIDEKAYWEKPHSDTCV